MSKSKSRGSRRVSSRAAKDVVAVSSVLAFRLPMLWLGAMKPTAARQREAVRMVTEKNAALMQGVLAAQMEMVKQSSALWLKAWRAPLTRQQLETSANRVADAAAAPARATLKANARRLKRRKKI